MLHLQLIFRLQSKNKRGQRNRSCNGLVKCLARHCREFMCLQTSKLGVRSSGRDCNWGRKKSKEQCEASWCGKAAKTGPSNGVKAQTHQSIHRALPRKLILLEHLWMLNLCVHVWVFRSRVGRSLARVVVPVVACVLPDLEWNGLFHEAQGQGLGCPIAHYLPPCIMYPWSYLWASWGWEAYISLKRNFNLRFAPNLTFVFPSS